MRITNILLDEVVVPARADSVNSPELDRPLHQLGYGGHRGFEVQFDAIPKTIVRIFTDTDMVGLGEFYRGVAVHDIIATAQKLVGRDVLSFNQQSLPVPEGRIYDGFECAFLDLIGKQLGVPLSHLLGGSFRDRVECSFWTGHRTTADAARKAREGAERGFKCIKFKCDANDPVVDWCQAISEVCGNTFQIILDPNRRWQTIATTLERADALHEIGNVLCLEDPLPRWNFSEYQLLRLKCRLPIAIHVSLPYQEMGQLPSDVISAIRNNSCDYFNLNGGCFPVKRLATVAELAGIPFWHGSEVDLGFLEASYVHKAAACANCTLPSDIFGRLVREHDLLLHPLDFDGRFVKVPAEPGLGVTLDEEALKVYSLRQHKVAS